MDQQDKEMQNSSKDEDAAVTGKHVDEHEKPQPNSAIPKEAIEREEGHYVAGADGTQNIHVPTGRGS